MMWKTEFKPLLWISAVFLIFYFLPADLTRVNAAMGEAAALAAWYAREHVILCLLTALLIAGAIGVFVGQAAVMKYLGIRANRVLAYGVAAVSGAVLAVCSCTVLPLFAGIYRMGAGLGPACAFLYAGPAINVLAVILTARVLGVEMGIARAIGAVVFSIVIGLTMHGLFRRAEAAREIPPAILPPDETRPLSRTVVPIALLAGILVFANWARPQSTLGLWSSIYDGKWWITGGLAALLGLITVRWFGARAWLLLTILPILLLAFLWPAHPEAAFAAGAIAFAFVLGTGSAELREWLSSTWLFTRQILPLLFYGVLIAGALLGRPGNEGLIPADWVSTLVGGNSLRANAVASVLGAFMYFATLTEVPIVQGLLGSGMGKGPALALLLAGPALSLPSMLVIRSVLGWKQTAAFIMLVVLMATITGVIYGGLSH